MTKSQWIEHIVCPVPQNEEQRLSALSRYESLDQPPVAESTFDRLAVLASRITGLPVCFINLIARDKQFTKAGVGSPDVTIDRKLSFCQYTIMQDDIMEVCDTLEHPVFKDSPFALGLEDLTIRYYIGVPLTTPDGYNIGSLCLIDSNPNELSDEQKETLKVLADEVVSQYELKASKANLELLNREKDELIRIVSHDLRNPLNGIIGFAEYLKSELENEEHKEMLGYIEEAGQSTKRIVDILLNTDYVKNQAFKLKCKPENVSELTWDVVKLLKPYNLIKKHQVEINIPDDLSWSIDADKWKQIVGNLLSNASKFTPAEGLIFMNLYVSDEDKNLVFEIQDSGMGMDQTMVNKLFSGNKSIRREGTNGEDSSGLGMLLIKRFVELHNGAITVKSKPGKGTKVTVRIG